MYLHTKLYCFISLIQSPKNLHHEENSLIIPRHMIFHGVTLYWPVLIPSFMFLTLKVPSKIYSRRHSKNFFFFIFLRKQVLTFHVNRLLWYSYLKLSIILHFVLAIFPLVCSKFKSLRYWQCYSLCLQLYKSSITVFTVNVLKFPTPKFPKKWHMQTVQTQIRLLLKEQSDQGLHCL